MTAVIGACYHQPITLRSCFISPAAPDSYAITAKNGESRLYGGSSPAFTLRVSTLSDWDRLVRAGTYQMANAFVTAAFEIEGDILAAVRWWRDCEPAPSRLSRWLMRVWAISQLDSWFSTEARARQQIRFHYDRSNGFYSQFLDQRMVYSCAYFADPAWDLDRAQVAKLEQICRKLDLEQTDRFLDVGCGWGALVIHAAQHYGAHAVGCTLSAKQVEFARDAVRARGLQERVAVDDLDYRNLSGRFDKIASVGMYEHVGRRRLGMYFQTLAGLLEPDGLLLNHGIARPAQIEDDGSTRFMRQHVFPGGELPYLEDVVRAAEQAGFEVLDIENLRPHYALTCAAWVTRLQSHRDQCLEEVDAETYRTWLLYLAACATSFERSESDVYQTLLAKRTSLVRRLRRPDAIHA